MWTRLPLLILIAVTQGACRPSIQQKDFASPVEAVHALVAAVQWGDMPAMLEVLGKEAEPVLSSGDPVQDSNSRARFLLAYSQARALTTDTDTATTLEVGTDKWPFPFPVVQRDGRWRFDSTAGAEEIINRRIGANELATIQSCLAFVDAQREYYVRNPERNSLQHYAHKLVSSEGRKDGLYWPTAIDEAPSPLGEEFARARSEGYFEARVSKAAPFHGYVYRLLQGQGPNATGGTYDYEVRGQLLGGFAVIAFPAEYATSGVMTFIVSHDGAVYSQDLGPETTAAVLSVASFDPDHSWTREAAIE